MKHPRRAIVLAAGFGSRLLPLTLDCPKPLVPLHGKAMIVHVLEQLQRWGVEEVLVNVHHLAEKIVAELPGICPAGVKLNFSFEADILGTGGGLRRMAWFFEDEPLWVCNADVWQQLDPTPLLDAYEQENPVACLWMLPESGPRTVKVEKGRVIDFRAGGMTFSGLHLISKRILPYLPDQTFSSVIDAYDAALAAGECIMGVTVPKSEWADVGTPEQLLATQGGSVVFPGAVVSKQVKLDQAIVGPGARLRKGEGIQGLVVAPHRGLSPDEHRRVSEVEAVGLLPVRGSDRSFRRLYFADHQEILICSGEGRPENKRFVGHTHFLHRKGIRVPRILRRAQQDRWLQVEDLGSEHLIDRLQTGSAARNLQDMRSVLALVADLHAVEVPKTLELEAPFDASLYKWECEFFEREFLKRHGQGSELRKLPASVFRASEGLTAQPQVLVHRDLQSTNLMKCADWVLIDYQGMRLGAAAYDLGSILADPYINRPQELQLELLAVYNAQTSHPISEEIYALGAQQRLLQALGAYGRLGALKGNERFLQFIPPALAQLRMWTEIPELQGLADEFLKGQTLANPLWEETHE
ncbi:sugar phosphate nucleotidyltransferase [Kiritimatiellota bacterium B12222]|nr:sugar phosphate nucleotidyltransferase [Kiritimatiellota bacterium B12222]